MRPNGLALENEIVEVTGLYRREDEDEFSWVARCCAALLALPEEELNSDKVSDEAYLFAKNNMDAMDMGNMIRGFNGYPLMALAKVYRFNGIAASPHARMKSLPPIPINFYTRGDKISLGDLYCLVAAPVSTGGRRSTIYAHGPISGQRVSATAAFRELAVCFAEDFEDEEVTGYGYALGIHLSPKACKTVLSNVRAVFGAVHRVFGIDVGAAIRQFKAENKFPVWDLFTRSMVDNAKNQYSALDFERKLLARYGKNLREDVDLYRQTGIVSGGLRKWAKDHGRLRVMESSGRNLIEKHEQDLSDSPD